MWEDKAFFGTFLSLDGEKLFIDRPLCWLVYQQIRFSFSDQGLHKKPES